MTEEQDRIERMRFALKVIPKQSTDRLERHKFQVPQNEAVRQNELALREVWDLQYKPVDPEDQH